jgi:hypothetical protein
MNFILYEAIENSTFKLNLLETNKKF